eukprot:scaffold87295_cov61-Phaeocystis_antarctica.AAC.2
MCTNKRGASKHHRPTLHLRMAYLVVPSPTLFRAGIAPSRFAPARAGSPQSLRTAKESAEPTTRPTNVEEADHQRAGAAPLRRRYGLRRVHEGARGEPAAEEREGCHHEQRPRVEGEGRRGRWRARAGGTTLHIMKRGTKAVRRSVRPSSWRDERTAPGRLRPSASPAV